MNHTTLEPLRTFRAAVYAALGHERNELFDLLDADLCAGPVASLAHLSLAASHRGGHGRLYRALARAQVDVSALRHLVASRSFLADDAHIFAIDVSPWPRPDAATSPERGFCHHASRHAHGQPVVPGWNYQWLAEVRRRHESWTAPLEVVRVPPRGNVHATAVAQVQRVLQVPARCPTTVPPPAPTPLVVFDAGYDAVQLGVGLSTEVAAGQVALLVRVRRNRCFYADPAPRAPAPAARGGRPPVHGRRFACADPRTWWAPTQDETSTDAQYGVVHVRAWAGVHGIPREHSGHVRRIPGGPGPDRRGHVPIVRGTLLLVEVEHLPRRTHAPPPLWLFWQGKAPAVPTAPRPISCGSGRRTSAALRWSIPSASANRPSTGSCRACARRPRRIPGAGWSWLVLLAYTQLRVARPLVTDHHLPWQPPLPPERLTPGRVRHGLSAVWAQLGTPTVAPQPRGRAPGRPRGRRSRPAPRFAVVKAPT